MQSNSSVSEQSYAPLSTMHLCRLPHTSLHVVESPANWSLLAHSPTQPGGIFNPLTSPPHVIVMESPRSGAAIARIDSLDQNLTLEGACAALAVLGAKLIAVESDQPAWPPKTHSFSPSGHAVSFPLELAGLNRLAIGSVEQGTPFRVEGAPAREETWRVTIALELDPMTISFLQRSVTAHGRLHECVIVSFGGSNQVLLISPELCMLSEGEHGTLLGSLRSCLDIADDEALEVSCCSIRDGVWHFEGVRSARGYLPPQETAVSLNAIAAFCLWRARCGENLDPESLRWPNGEKLEITARPQGNGLAVSLSTTVELHEAATEFDCSQSPTDPIWSCSPELERSGISSR